MSDERKRLDELIKLMIQERIGNMLFLTEDDDEEPISGEQLSWLDGQGSQDLERRRAEENKSFYDESEMSLPWDDRLQELQIFCKASPLMLLTIIKDVRGSQRKQQRLRFLPPLVFPLMSFSESSPNLASFIRLTVSLMKSSKMLTKCLKRCFKRCF